jgi:hypothetical protein
VNNNTTSRRPVIREHFRAARAARAQRRSLERDLASYTSAADLNDLAAMLDRHSDEETAHIRQILAGHRLARTAGRGIPGAHADSHRRPA